jgi:hypothetical protein
VEDVERVLEKLDALASEVSDLRVAVARLDERSNITVPKPGLARDGGITISGGAIGAVLAFALQHFTK